MGTIADLLIKLRVDTKSAEQELSGFSGKAKGALSKGLVPSIAVLGVLGVAAKGATAAASDLGESQNAVSVVFGKSASIVSDFAKVADKEAGLSMRELNSLVTPVGAGLQNYGFSAKDAATASVDLAKRAADMASVFNTSVPEALAAVQSGLRGEADPLEKFGVGLNDAAVTAKALAMGLQDETGKVTMSAKAKARLALILEQTSKYQGDFAKTSTSAANAARINKAAADNLNASMGKGLLPVVQTLQAAFSGLIGFMANHTTTVKVATGVVAGLATAVIAVNLAQKASAALTAIASAAKVAYTTVTGAATAATAGQTGAQVGLNAAMRANPIGLVITALALLGGGLLLAWQKSETFRDIVKGAFDVVKRVAQEVANFITKTIPAAFQAVKDWVSANWPIIATIISGPFAPLVALATNAFGIRDKFQRAMTAIKDWASDAISAIVGFFTGLPGKIGAAARNAGSAFVDGIKSGLSTLGSALATAVKAPINAIIGAWNNLGIPSFDVKIPMPDPIPDIGFSTPGISLPDIPKLAQGGIVARPTIALIGEAGPEAVVPLGKAGQFAEDMGMGGTRSGAMVRIDTMVVQDATDVDKVASRLGRHLAMGLA